MLDLVLLAGGVIVVVAGAELFFDGLLGAARRFGLSAFVLTVVISGFELENLAAGIAANARGLEGAAAGTFLGGTTFLALGVAGMSALLIPLTGVVLPGRAYAWTAAAPLPLVALGIDGRLSRVDGGLLVVWFVVALRGLARAAPIEEAVAARVARLPVLRIVGGLVLLGAGGALLGDGLRRVVDRFGVSDTVLGNTAIAAAVEAEEIGRPIAAARRGRGDLALANVTGTIVHFAALNAGIIALVRPLDLDGPTRWLHLPAAAGSAALLSLLAWRERGIGRTLGVALLVLYGTYVAGTILAG